MAKAQEYVVGILFSRENRTEVEFHWLVFMKVGDSE